METQGISMLMGTDVTFSQSGTARKAAGSSLKDTSFSSYFSGNTAKPGNDQMAAVPAASDNRISVSADRVKLTVKDNAKTGSQTGKNVHGAGKMASAQSPADDLEVDIGAAEKQIAALLAQIFGMTEDEVKGVLAQDGNSISDMIFQIDPENSTVSLVNTDVLRQLVMGVHGIDDPSAFLMNDTLTTELTQVTDAVTGVVADMFGVAPDELDTVEEMLALSFAEQLMNQTQLTPDQSALQTEGQTGAASEEIATQDAADSEWMVTVEDYTQTAGDTVDTASGVQKNETAGNDSGQSSDGGENGQENGNEGTASFGRMTEQTGEKKSILPESATPETMRQTFTEQLAQAFGETAEEVQAPEMVMNRIVEQIVRQVRIRVLPETTSMELQLTPAALGKVNLQVSMTGGVSTASMTVETQAAKEALESQMIQLKQAFAEQGLKVDAVEVTVSEFGLRQDQSQGQAQEQQNRQNGKKAFREEAGSDVLEDSEGHTTESSRRDVNSVVDYTA